MGHVMESGLHMGHVMESMQQPKVPKPGTYFWANIILGRVLCPRTN
jgi:hypothetical protein